MIGTIKPMVEKKFKTFFIFYATGGELHESVQNKTSFVSLRSRFGGGNRKHFTKERRNALHFVLFLLKSFQFINDFRLVDGRDI